MVGLVKRTIAGLTLAVALALASSGPADAGGFSKWSNNKVGNHLISLVNEYNPQMLNGLTLMQQEIEADTDISDTDATMNRMESAMQSYAQSLDSLSQHARGKGQTAIEGLATQVLNIESNVQNLQNDNDDDDPVAADYTNDVNGIESAINAYVKAEKHAGAYYGMVVRSA
jgi:hypothetical protein